MRYYKIHLGHQNSYTTLGIEGGFIGIGYEMPDLSSFDSNQPDFKEKLKEIYITANPTLTRMQIASAVGNVYRFIKVFSIGDVVLTPLGDGTYKVGKISSEYYFAGEAEPIAQRRKVEWFATLDKETMSQGLKNTLGAIGTISDITHQSVEIEALLSGSEIRAESVRASLDEQEFALEEHLEDFLIKNWQNTELGKNYDLFKDEDGQVEAQQYPTEVGPIDILAIKKDGTEILVIELKKGRSGDAVVGQTLRYITAIKKEVADPNQRVRALIITGQDDKKIRYSIAPLDGLIEFMTYKLKFSLDKMT